MRTFFTQISCGAGIANLPAPSSANDAARKAYVDLFLPLAGGTLTGNLVLAGNPSIGNHAANKTYVDLFVPLAGGTMSGALTLSGAPSAGNHAVTKTYADSLIAGGTKWLNPVRVLMAADVPDLAEFDDLIDNIALANGDRVALVAQTDPTQNGVYVWTDATNSFARAADLPAAAEAAAVAFFVSEGDTYADQCWRCTDNEGSDVVGTDPLTFTQFGASFTPTQSYPIEISGNNISILINGAQFGVNGSNELYIITGGITGTEIADGAITFTHIQDATIPFTKMDFPVAQMHAEDITGDAIETDFVVTHNLNTLDVIVQVVDPDNDSITVEAEITRISVNEVNVGFAVAPADTKVYRVVVVGHAVPI